MRVGRVQPLAFRRIMHERQIGERYLPVAIERHDRAEQAGKALDRVQIITPGKAPDIVELLTQARQRQHGAITLEPFDPAQQIAADRQHRIMLHALSSRAGAVREIGHPAGKGSLPQAG